MILEIILICIIVFCGFLYYRQDSIIKGQVDYINNLENAILKNIQSITRVNARMKEIDSKGGFESDDEVGQIFHEIKAQIEELENEINNG